MSDDSRTREREPEITGSMANEPQFEPFTNENLQCADCRFQIPDGGVLRCHKYDMKPTEVLNGGQCPKYKPE